MTTDPGAMQDELLASSEWRVVARIHAFGFSVRLLERNAEELGHVLRYLADGRRSFPLMAQREKPRRDLYLEEVGRLLHNFVASVYSLIEHTDHLHEEMCAPNGTFPEYEEERDGFQSARISLILGALRVWFQHYVLPPIAYVEGEGFERHLVLSRAKFLRAIDSMRKRWMKARPFVEREPEEIDITSLMQEYLTAARDFHRRFSEQLVAAHRREYAVVDSALARIARARGPSVVTALAAAIAEVEAGTRSLADVLGRWMSPQDELELELLLDHLPSWTDCVLARLEERYAPLPAELAARYRAASRRGDAPPPEPGRP